MTDGSRALRPQDERRIYDLGHPLHAGMPVSPNHPGFRMALLRRHGDMVRADGGSAANELLVLGGHTGTHLDALAHVSANGLLHGGVEAEGAQRGGRFSSLGVETVEPIVCRGVLLDVAGSFGVDELDPGTPITDADLDRAADAQATRIEGAGAILIRSGWGRHWDGNADYLGMETGVPGPDISAAAWIRAAQPIVAAHDSMAFEVVPPGAGHALLPVHGALLVDAGIHIIENIDLEALARDRVYEFTFICVPLPFVGATGSPVRPLALIPA